MITIFIRGERAQSLRLATSDPEDTEQRQQTVAKIAVFWEQDVPEVAGDPQFARELRINEAWRRLHMRVTGKHAIVGCSVDFMVSVMTDKLKKMGYPLVNSGILHK